MMARSIANAPKIGRIHWCKTQRPPLRGFPLATHRRSIQRGRNPTFKIFEHISACAPAPAEFFQPHPGPVLWARLTLKRQARKRLKDPLLWRKLACGDFARLVMLTGHGSMTANNRHASGFDCGTSGVTSIRGSLTQLPAHAIFD